MSERIAQLLAALNNPSLPGIDLSLDRVSALLKALGDPQDKLPPVIHVAGTNGKGSTIAFLCAIYEAAGYRVHVYTSPHLVRFNERIVLAGKEIDDALLEHYLEEVNMAAQGVPVTFFEATTAAAFLAFANHPADLLLLEVGLGGRLDATNIITRPLASVLTPISIDHAEFLGGKLAGIATEKAGIIKRGVPCISAAQLPEALEKILEKSAMEQAPLFLGGRDWDCAVTAQEMTFRWKGQEYALPAPSLKGAHQYANAALAAATVLALVQQFKVTPQEMGEGLLTARWPARLQVLTRGPLVTAWGRGPVMLDGGHNADAGRALAAWMAVQKQPVYLMAGMMRRKDAESFFRPLAKHAAGLACIPILHHADAYTPEELAEQARMAGFPQPFVAASPVSAVRAFGSGNGVLLATGSLFLAGELLKDHA